MKLNLTPAQKRWAIIVSLGIVISMACVAYWKLHAKKEVTVSRQGSAVNVPRKATPAASVAAAPTQKVKLEAPALTVYADSVKPKLKLPARVVASPTQHVIAASTIAPDDHPVTVSTVIDSQTGQSETYTVEQPLPLLARESRAEVGAYVGVKNLQPTARIEARYDFLQVKALHAGVLAGADVPISGMGRPDAFVGVGVTLRW